MQRKRLWDCLCAVSTFAQILFSILILFISMQSSQKLSRGFQQHFQIRLALIQKAVHYKVWVNFDEHLRLNDHGPVSVKMRRLCTESPLVIYYDRDARLWSNEIRICTENVITRDITDHITEKKHIIDDLLSETVLIRIMSTLKRLRLI